MKTLYNQKPGISTVVAFKRYVGLTLDDGSTMKVKIAQGSTVEVATGVTIVCVREDRSF